MPGLVVIAWDSRAEARARRAGQPLLRRSWERLSLVTASDGSVAIGFAGERGGVADDELTGCLLAFDGELYGPPQVRSGDEGAHELLSLYLRDGGGISPPEGRYAAAVWDARTDELVLITDRFRGRELYVAREGGTLIAAGELKALVAAGFSARLDLTSAAQMLMYALWVSDRSLLAGARLLPGATTLFVGRESVREVRRWRYRARPVEDGRVDDRELVEEFGRLFRGALSNVRDGTECLALSGGLDSRCVAAVLADDGFAGTAASYGPPGSGEMRLATRVARRAGLAHRALWLDRGFMVRGAPSSVWLSDGRKGAFSSHGATLRVMRGEHGARSILIGDHGDDVLRLDPVTRLGHTETTSVSRMHEALMRATGPRLEAALTPGFGESLRGLAEGELASTLVTREGGWTAPLAGIIFDDTSIESTALFHDHLTPRTPYNNRELVEFCSTLPYRLRYHGVLQREFLRRHRKLARVPVWEDGVPPALPANFVPATRHVVAASRDAGKRLRRRLPLRPRRYRYAFFEDVMLASDGLAVLLEERTLSRGQLQRDVVRRYVSALTAGSLAYPSVLGRLLRLELFQRQFVDGDGAPNELD